MCRSILRAVTPTIITSDLTMREHWELLRAARYSWWYAVVPGWVVGWHQNRTKGAL